MFNKFLGKFWDKTSSNNLDPTKCERVNTDTDTKTATGILPENKFYHEIADLPEYESLLTAGAGPYALSESFHSKLAVLGLGKQSALLLADPNLHNRQDFASLLSRVQKDYRVVHIGLAKSSVMLSLYSKSAPLAKRRDRDVSETALSVSLFKDILSKAAQVNASDVHFLIRDEHVSGFTKIKFRVDGVLRLFDTLPSSNAVEAVGVAYTKLADDLSRSDPAFNSRSMQNCSIPIALNGRDYKLRYQTIPVNGGLDVILRLLQSVTEDVSETADLQAKSLEELGYSPAQCKQLDFAARKTVGTIIIAGVTGSGKSTTLKTLMTVSPTRHQRKLYSIEDPVEYQIPGVSQKSVQRQALNSDGSGFTAAMRVVLRGDPDVVMVGEVRDNETCSLLKTMVQSGHQVMTSVHAASAIDIVQRLTSSELGLPRETLGSRNFLSALVYQRLVPILCPQCKLELDSAREDEAHRDTLQLLRNKFGLDPFTMFMTNPDGCEHCSFLGSKGVTVVAEIILPDNILLRHLRKGHDVEAEEYWRGTRSTAFNHPDSTGKTAFEHGLFKAHLGLVDPYVIENSFEPFETYILYPMTAPSAPQIVPQIKIVAGTR